MYPVPPLAIGLLSLKFSVNVRIGIDTQDISTNLLYRANTLPATYTLDSTFFNDLEVHVAEPIFKDTCAVEFNVLGVWAFLQLASVYKSNFVSITGLFTPHGSYFNSAVRPCIVKRTAIPGLAGVGRTYLPPCVTTFCTGQYYNPFGRGFIAAAAGAMGTSWISKGTQWDPVMWSKSTGLVGAITSLHYFSGPQVLRKSSLRLPYLRGQLVYPINP